VRIARFAKGDGVAYGIVEGEAVAELHGHPFGVDPGAVRLTGRAYPLAEVRLLAPVLPSKVVGVADELFLKPSTAVTGPADAIKYPVKLADRVTFSGQLAVIIGRLCHQVPRERADEVVFGYSCATDVTAGGLDVTRAKAFDTFCPLGPWMETAALPVDFGITASVNGTVRASSRTAPDVAELISYVSEVMTLLPGDVLLTGPVGDGGQIGPGDEVAVTIEGIGTLTSRVIAD
jgi:2-keto-4-pentenoate hydratase/2-oxohepta-3-ene-1,7-dioic acid hydratase in catechol pathway